MPRYKLDYKEPYEFDDGDSQSADHETLWSAESKTFDVKDDEAAKNFAQEFLSKEFKICGEIQRRQIIQLVEMNPDRVVR